MAEVGSSTRSTCRFTARRQAGPPRLLLPTQPFSWEPFWPSFWAILQRPRPFCASRQPATHPMIVSDDRLPHIRLEAYLGSLSFLLGGLRFLVFSLCLGLCGVLFGLGGVLFGLGSFLGALLFFFFLLEWSNKEVGKRSYGDRSRKDTYGLLLQLLARVNLLFTIRTNFTSSGSSKLGSSCSVIRVVVRVCFRFNSGTDFLLVVGVEVAETANFGDVGDLVKDLGIVEIRSGQNRTRRDFRVALRTTFVVTHFQCLQ